MPNGRNVVRMPQAAMPPQPAMLPPQAQPQIWDPSMANTWCADGGVPD